MVMLASLYKRQGMKITDWEAYEKHKAERKAKNVENAREVLHKNCVAWDELSHRVGTEQLVAFNVFKPMGVSMDQDIMLTFYPEIGKWYDANYKIRFGVRNLVRYIIGEKP